MKLFVTDVLLPYSLPGTLLYVVPEALLPKLQIGVRVVVPLKTFFRVGVVVGMPRGVDSGEFRFELKSIVDILDESPILTQGQLWLLHWISDYYCARPGDVLSAFLPVSLRMDEEMMVERLLGEVTDPFPVELSWVVELFGGEQVLSLVDVMKRCPREKGKSLPRYLETLQKMGYLRMVARLKPEAFRILHYIYLAPPYNSGKEAMQRAFSAIEEGRKIRQERLLMTFLALINEWGGDLKNGFPRRLVLKKSKSPESVLKELIAAGILEERIESSSLLLGGGIRNEILLKELNSSQQEALNSIESHFQSGKRVVLLHGVTGSGKTEIYFHLIAKTLAEGKQALYILPEIALTSQMVGRLQAVFGERVGLFHSRVPEKKRAELYRGLLARAKGDRGKGVDVVLGVRSSVLLPFSRLGLIVVDEEHDGSFKQESPPPYYSARDVAIMLGQHHGAPVLLGSATPSVESYYLATQGLYGLVSLSARYGEAVLPSVQVLDMRHAAKRELTRGSFHLDTLRALKECVEAGGQAIIFRNRRGFAPYIECLECGWVPMCVNCDVRLTYHSSDSKLHCHHCGHQESSFQVCPECGSRKLATRGLGTQRVERELKEYMPELKVARLDLDTARSRIDILSKLDDFAEGLVDVLVGTQMVTKGMDFERVTLVVVMDMDATLSMPDFRAWETAFAQMAQVGGRAGRGKRPGSVLIQSRNPGHRLFEWVKGHDYIGFYQHAILERQQLDFPPFYRLVEVMLLDSKNERLQRAVGIYGAYLHEKLGSGSIVGPYPPQVAWEKRLHRMMFQVKIPREVGPSAVKRELLNAAALLEGDKDLRTVQVLVNVDPR